MNGEMIKLMEFIKNGKGIPYTTRKRIYIIIRLLYSTMARVSEITNAKIQDVDFKNKIIKLKGKGNKERIVPIDNDTLIKVREYLTDRIIYKDTDPLFINKFGQAISVRTIQKDIQIILIILNGHMLKNCSSQHYYYSLRFCCSS